MSDEKRDIQARCLTCRFSIEQPLDKTLQRQLICRALPPQIIPMAHMTPQGPVQQLVPMWPPVHPDMMCFQYVHDDKKIEQHGAKRSPLAALPQAPA